jgi:alanine racemase
MPAFNPILEIDLAAICANYRAMADAAPSAEAAAVVKCDAYGVGAAATARALAAYEKCRIFFVAYPEEGVNLRRALGDFPAEIFVFNGPFRETLAIFEQARLTPVLNSLEQAALWAHAKPTSAAALHIDTGMNRSGAAPEDLAAIIAIDGLNITLAMSHLACISDPAHPMNDRQQQDFAAAAKLFPKARTSLSSSGGALAPQARALDLVRLGVGLYGVSPFDVAEPRLSPVATLRAPVMQTHAIKAGAPVGYGAGHVAARDGMLATVLLGYGDGFPRSASNRAAAMISGRRCPIVGRVSMDMIILDVSDLPAPPKTGDMAEFFGRNLPIEESAAACGTIGYELLTGIGGLARKQPGLGGRVIRRYLWGDAPADSFLAGDEGMA